MDLDAMGIVVAVHDATLKSLEARIADLEQGREPVTRQAQPAVIIDMILSRLDAIERQLSKGGLVQ